MYCRAELGRRASVLERWTILKYALWPERKEAVLSKLLLLGPRPVT